MPRARPVHGRRAVPGAHARAPGASGCGPRSSGCFDDDGGQRQAGHGGVALREGLAPRTRIRPELRDDRAGLCDVALELRVLGRVAVVQAGSDDGDGAPPGLQGGFVGGGVDAGGQARDDGDVGGCEVARRSAVASRTPSLEGRRVPITATDRASRASSSPATKISGGRSWTARRFSGYAGSRMVIGRMPAAVQAAISAAAWLTSGAGSRARSVVCPLSSRASSRSRTARALPASSRSSA